MGPIMPPAQPIVMPAPQPVAPADPYNCADGFANWQAGWSVPKKEWCCRVHGKGCPNQGGGCVTSSKPYDCNAGFANWMAGWSVAKMLGVAVMKARAAHQQLEGVLRSRAEMPWQRFCCEVISHLWPDSCSTGIRAIFRCAASAF